MNRTENFKIGTFHGRLTPEKSEEVRLRNALFLIGNIIIPLGDIQIQVRLIGYEVPIEYRGKRIDLLGYDAQMNPWVIELKAGNSSEELQQVVDQINGYTQIVVQQLPQMENEFEEKFFIPLKLTPYLKKLILAPREYFEGKDKTAYPDPADALVCSIARVRTSLIDNLDKYDEVTLRVVN